MPHHKTAIQIQKKIELLIPQFSKYTHIVWVSDYIQYVQKEFKSLTIGHLSYREKRRIQKHCHTSLREFHRICIQIFAATQTTPLPEWMKWTYISEKKDFYKQLLMKLSSLDSKTVYLISYTLPKSLSSYEEDIFELFRVEEEKTSETDYKTLLKLSHSLEAQLDLLGKQQ